MLGSKISNAPETESLAVSFTHLKLRREHEEDYMKVGESKVGIGLQGSYIMCSLEGGHAYFKGMLT